MDGKTHECRCFFFLNESDGIQRRESSLLFVDYAVMIADSEEINGSACR